jgi:uncharacterized membrane protein YuzA (DUF378 family)
MKNLDILDWIALVLIIVGGLNWGMIALFNVDLVSTLFGTMTTVTRIVYGLVGIGALYSIYTLSSKTQ